ncbi:hypothetical protein MG290_03755 [Flavobacterium sp. CBA20B-1]|uniref:hypothetical protein n=1 Tax=unclassified Flavobacterium TaxID=196869 RepID=UPI0022258E47|nr:MULTISPECIES: hypothetical protein [unclassified Flavobacterium]WCM42808.1 hypothetical protein MG290_03755 [Flavobacterium sp. CBA20B-1]
MYTVEVKNSKTRRQFLNFPAKLYAHDKNWIHPLDQDIEKVFDTEKNKLFKRGGKAIRWVLFNGNDEIIGRIAAFINPKYEGKNPVGGFGFFECINDQKAANLLFNQAKKWLEENGMETMDGPINFGERDQWWGLLVEGFHEPLYNMNYNFPYYVELFENYGFKTYFNQECYSLPFNQQLQPKLYDRHANIAKDPAFKAEHIKLNNLDKYVADFVTIYNKAWASHGGGKDMPLSQGKLIFKTMKPVIDPKIVWFVYYKEQPVAFWLNLPDLNQYFKHLNGKFGLLEKIKFLWYKTFQKSKRVIGIAFGVVPEWQGKGVDNFMIIEGQKVIKQQSGYTDYEMQWIGDFNPKMINVAKSLGANLSRKLRTYRYHFDPSKPVEKHKILR